MVHRALVSPPKCTLDNGITDIGFNQFSGFESETQMLPSAIEHAHRTSSEEIRAKIGRLLKIWEERQVYDKVYLDEIREKLPATFPYHLHHERIVIAAKLPPTFDSEDATIDTTSVADSNEKDVRAVSKTPSTALNSASHATPEPSADDAVCAKFKELSMLLLDQGERVIELDAITAAQWKAFETAVQQKKHWPTSGIDANVDGLDFLTTLDMLLGDQEAQFAKQARTCELVMKLMRDKGEQCEKKRAMVRAAKEGRPVHLMVEGAIASIPQPPMNRGVLNQNHQLYPDPTPQSRSKNNPTLPNFPPPIPHPQNLSPPISPIQQGHPFVPFPPPPPPRGPPPLNQPRLHNAFTPPQPLPPGTSAYMHPYAPLPPQPSISRPDRSNFLPPHPAPSPLPTPLPPPADEPGRDAQAPPPKRPRVHPLPSRPTAAELWRGGFPGRDADGDFAMTEEKRPGKRKNDDEWRDDDLWEADEADDDCDGRGAGTTKEPERANFARSSHGKYSGTTSATDIQLATLDRRTSLESAGSIERAREPRTLSAMMRGESPEGVLRSGPSPPSKEERLARVAAWVKESGKETARGAAIRNDDGWRDEDGWGNDDDNDGSTKSMDTRQTEPLVVDHQTGSFSPSREASRERHGQCDTRDSGPKLRLERKRREEGSKGREGNKEENGRHNLERQGSLEDKGGATDPAVGNQKGKAKAEELENATESQ
ncbi:hypothetical protein BC938DRAFT_475149 [Jimgerdemannia flammicorona]|uniref:CID domain-containing protein n=1 Tax=Jimgerdemannia flammicorona TaxID=994334 RepID=A0A433QRV8_9FUNG|nr:hypothetical protein BC938DRAFT_475149 [Jimgerdemannia flammicorona]